VKGGAIAGDRWGVFPSEGIRLGGAFGPGPKRAFPDKIQKGAPPIPEERPKTRPNREAYTWNELPHPQVDLTWGLLNLNPEPSSVSTKSTSAPSR